MNRYVRQHFHGQLVMAHDSIKVELSYIAVWIECCVIGQYTFYPNNDLRMEDVGGYPSKLGGYGKTLC